MNNERKEIVFSAIKFCGPNGVKPSGIIDGLDFTIFSFIDYIPNEIIPENILIELELRMLRHITTLNKHNFEFKKTDTSLILGKTPENPTERTRLISEKIKSLNQFNGEGKKVAAIFIKEDKINVVISKELNTTTFTSLLNKFGEKIKPGGGSVAWSLELPLFNLISFLLDDIQDKYHILGLEEYEEDLGGLLPKINAIPFVNLVSSHQIPKKIIVSINEDYFEILCGSDALKTASYFLRPLDSKAQNSVFKIEFRHAKVIKTMIKALEGSVIISKDVEENLDSLIELEAEDNYATIKRGSIPQQLFSTLSYNLTSIKATIQHYPKNDGLTSKITKYFKKGTFTNNKNNFDLFTIQDLLKFREIVLQFSIDVYSNYGHGNAALSSAAEYLTRIKQEPKATIKFIGGRRFEIIRFSNSKSLIKEFVSESDKTSLLNFIEKNKPVCDQLTVSKIKDLNNLGLNKVHSKNGRTFIISAHCGDFSRQIDFVPPHCVRQENGATHITILTATHGEGLKKMLMEDAFTSKRELDTVIPMLNNQIQEFKSRYDKSYSHIGSIQIPNFGGNDRLESSQRACIEYGLEVPYFMVGDEPGFGKTWEGLGYVELKQAYPCIIIVPKIGKLSWSYEFKNLIKDRSSLVLGSKPPGERDSERKEIKNVDVVIVNYDMLDEFIEELCSTKWKALIVDESHYTKYADTIRTRNVHLVKEKTQPNIIMQLSGSFWENRPAELLPQLKLVSKLGIFGGENAFLKRYCTTQGKANGMGASNLDELNEVMRTHFMIRRQKEQGGKSKWRQAYVPVEDLNLSEYKKVEANLAQYIFGKVNEEVEMMIERNPSLAETREEITLSLIRKRWVNSASKSQKLVEISKLRELIGLAKIEPAIEFIDSILSGENKLVVFAYHQEVQKRLFAHFNKSKLKTVQIKSQMDDLSRKQAEEEFLLNDARLIICSVGSASENINFASASHVLFVEGGWKPMTQARMRIDRKPQQSTILNAWYLRAMGTIDDWLYDMSESKASDFSKGSGDKTVNKIDAIESDDFASILVKRHYKNSTKA